MKKNAFLVIGGDSPNVGKALVKELKNKGHEVYSSTRRKETIPCPPSERIYIDLKDPSSYRVPDNVGYAYIVITAGTYDICESNPESHKINVELTPNLAHALFLQGIFVTFISSNTIFGGNIPWPDEETSPAPTITYSIQKTKTESAILKIAKKLDKEDCFAIVRIPKIMTPETSPLPTWFELWKHNTVVEPFTDLIFAPISQQSVGHSLAIIGEKNMPGNWHLSGSANINYVDFAMVLAQAMNIDPQLISPTTAIEKGVRTPFRPKYCAVSMKRTTDLLGLIPQTVENVVIDILDTLSKG